MSQTEAPPRATQSPVITALRLETRDSHERLEETVNLETISRSREAYTGLLKKFYGFWKPFESCVAAKLDSSLAPPEIDQRWRAHLLERDLRELEVDPAEIALVDLHFDDWSLGAIAGRLYVSEGSTLGGQVISRRLAERLQIDAESGGSFFSGHGELTGRRWKEFCAWLESAVDATEIERCARAADEIFQNLNDWLCSEHGGR